MNNEKKKLLIVEDDPGLQKQLRWCFENYDVIIAEDKASALEEVRLQNPPVVLQDLGLPPDPAGVSAGAGKAGGTNPPPVGEEAAP